MKTYLIVYTVPITYSFSLIRKENVAYLGVGIGGRAFHLLSSRSILRKKSRGFVSVAIPPITNTRSSETKMIFFINLRANMIFMISTVVDNLHSMLDRQGQTVSVIEMKFSGYLSIVVNFLKFQPFDACLKGLNKQCRPRSDCF